MDELEFLEWLNQVETVYTVDDIDYTKGNPEKNIHNQRCLWAWIDIMGYSGLVKINDTFYIDSNPVDRGVIKYEMWETVPEGPDWKVYPFRYKTTKYIQDDKLFVEMVVELWYKHEEPGPDDKYYDRLTIYDSLWLPTTYPEINTTGYNVTVFNNTINPRSTVWLPYDNKTIGYHLEFDNESIDYYHNVLKIEELDNGFNYGNLTPAPAQSIYEKSGVFSRMGDTIIINSTEVNNSLRMWIITPYEEIELNYTVANFTGPQKMEKEQARSLAGILVLVWGTVVIINRFGLWVHK